jgi:hypothetical protein
MPKKTFEISERKMILRLFDVLFVLLVLYAIGYFRFYLDSGNQSVSGAFFVIYLSVLQLFLNVF